MSPTPSIIDPFHRSIYTVVSEAIDKRMVALAGGSAVRTTNDEVSTAEKYAAQVSYLQAMNDVLEWCMEIENDRYGKKPGEGEQDAG
jgi:hypothetical protein